ncbi:hypothetical protein ACFWWT_41840 [Streptomyces sp. NPDC058676]|uniref:hypothetical protein n=1 Tax=unclassified Streptomyces TaxID=2593676 RepID=UPI0036580541
MTARRQIIVAWAGLCLLGIVATAVLDAGPSTQKSDSPVEEPTPVATGTYAIECQDIADHIEQARARAKREQQEALNRYPSPGQRGTFTVEDVAVPEECADELSQVSTPSP